MRIKSISIRLYNGMRWYNKSPLFFSVLMSHFSYQQAFKKAEERESVNELESVSVAIVHSEVKLFVVSLALCLS